MSEQLIGIKEVSLGLSRHRETTLDPIILWNPNGLNQEKWAKIQAKIQGLVIPKIYFFTESHVIKNLMLPKTLKLIQNPNRYYGVAIIHSNSISVTDIWRSDDGRVLTCIINTKDQTIHVFLGYWPATSEKDRKQFNEKYKDMACAADLILGDFNSVEKTKRDSNWSRNHSSPGFEQMIINKIDPAVEHIKNSDGLYTNRHLGKTSRIDRAYASPNITIRYINNLDFSSNNSHCPVLYNIGLGNSQKKKFHWKLIPGLFQSREARTNLKKALSKITYSETDSTLEYLHKVKEVVMKVQKKSLKEKKKWIYRVKDLMKRIPKFDKRRKEMEAALKEMGNLNLEKKRLMAGKKWTLHNECPNSMLTRILKSQKTNAFVKTIRHPKTDKVVDTPVEVMDAFHVFYQNLYKKKEIDHSILKRFLEGWSPEIDASALSNLSNSFTLEELYKAFKQMKDLKAPGMSGIPALPFKLLPEDGLIKLLNLYNEILVSGVLPNEWKRGEVITLFKKGDVLEIRNRRPITLLETEYKILSKMITNRLKILMPQLINIDQVGFIPNRIIYDNILVAQEVLSKDKKYTISVDFAKAYDSISHETIYKILEHLNFPPSFTNLVKGMISGSEARIRNGDWLSEFFKVDSGVKQGCPLSPLLFALAIEPLADYIRKYTTGTSLGDLTQSIILYADDIFLFAANELEQLKQIKILDDFRMASGLTMNKDKSLHISTHSNDLGIPPCGPEGFKYLGFWMNSNGLMDKSKELVNKVRMAVNRWKFFSWNTRQKAAVLQTYVMSKLWYHSFILDMHKSIPDIEKIRKNFLWQNQFDGKISNRTKQRQERTELSRKNGGLGLDDLTARFNAQKAWIIDMCFNRETKIGQIWKELYGISKTETNISFNTPERVKGYWDNYSKLPAILKPTRKPNEVPLVGLKQWTFFLSKASTKPIPSTPRQERLKKDSNVDLIKLFLNVKKSIKDVKTRDFIWNFCNGTLIYDRGKKCPCGKQRNLEHIFFSCRKTNTITDWYKSIPVLYQSANAGQWTEKNILTHLQTSKSPVSLALYIGLIHSLWISRDSPVASKRIFKESFQSIMIAEWYFAKYHPDYILIPTGLTQKFHDRWGQLCKLSKTNIPILKKW